MRKLLKQLNKWLKFNFRRYSLELLLKETGVDLSPDPEVFGMLSQAEEENVLSRLYDDKEWCALMKKYAEGATKAMIMAIKSQNNRQADRFNAQFFCYNSQLLKARRASLKVKKINDSKSIT